MKMEKVFLVKNGRAEQLKEATRRHRARSGKKTSLPEGFYGDFGGVNMGQAPPIDAMLMPALNAALTQLPEAIHEAFLQRGLLPRPVNNALSMARFLSFALLPARAAQESFGVRASILLADAIHHSGEWMDKYVGDSNDVFDTGRHFSDFTDAFLDRAQELKKNLKFRAVMRAMGDPTECLKQLGLCEFWYELERSDRVSTITDYCLQDCDLTRPILPIA